MKPGRISNIIILFYLGMILYEIFYPAFPRIDKPWWWVALRCFYYMLSYGVLFAVTYHGYKKTTYKSDSLALFSLLIYSAGKFVYYMFIINKDMPTYIDWCNSKLVSLVISVLLWSFSVVIWIKRYKIKQLLKISNYAKRI